MRSVVKSSKSILIYVSMQVSTLKVSTRKWLPASGNSRFLQKVLKQPVIRYGLPAIFLKDAVRSTELRSTGIANRLELPTGMVPECTQTSQIQFSERQVQKKFMIQFVRHLLRM